MAAVVKKNLITNKMNSRSLKNQQGSRSTPQLMGAPPPPPQSITSLQVNQLKTNQNSASQL